MRAGTADLPGRSPVTLLGEMTRMRRMAGVERSLACG